MLELFQYENCYSCEKVRKHLEKLKLEYKKIEVNRFNKPKEVTRTGGTVPVLRDGVKIISDSEVIITYLNKKYGKK